MHPADGISPAPAITDALHALLVKRADELEGCTEGSDEERELTAIVDAGDEAVLKYLARYVFRVAITDNRIVGLDATGVTLRHKHPASNR